MYLLEAKNIKLSINNKILIKCFYNLVILDFLGSPMYLLIGNPYLTTSLGKWVSVKLKCSYSRNIQLFLNSSIKTTDLFLINWWAAPPLNIKSYSTSWASFNNLGESCLKRYIKMKTSNTGLLYLDHKITSRANCNHNSITFVSYVIKVLNQVRFLYRRTSSKFIFE